MTDQERLEIAVKALEEIRSLDGWGADLSPPGPCCRIADDALHKIRTRTAEVRRRSKKVRGSK